MRKLLRLFSCLPVLLVLSAAGSDVTAGPVTLTGRVADPQGRPLGGAEVWILIKSADPERAAVTGADGRFEVPGLSRYQSVVLDVCRDGYFFARTELEDVSPDLLPVTLEPAGSLSGRLHGPDGPFAGKFVRARRDGVLKAQGTVSACRTGEEWARTDSQGRFTIAPLRPGLYWLDAEVNGYRLHRLGYIPVSAGKREVDVPLERGDVVLTGKVTDPTGLPIPGIEIVARNDELVRVTTSKSGPDGIYRITGLEPGKGSVRIWDDMMHEKEMVFVHGENRMDFITLPDPPVYPVRGRVREPSGQPVAWAHVQFSDLRPGTDRKPAPRFATVTRADGTFAIQLPPGPYEVEAWKPGFFAVRRPGSLTVEDHAPEDLDLRMPPGAVLTGRVLGLPRGKIAEIEARGPLPLSGEVDEDALYRLPFGEHRFELPQGEYLPDGTYRISDLGPGTWEIRAGISGSLVARERKAHGRVTIPPGAAHVHLDLDFGAPQR